MNVTVRKPQLLALVLVLTACLLARGSGAEEAVPVQLQYAAVEGCPGSAAFVERLRLHTRRLRLSNAEDALRLDVGVTRRGSGFLGRLSVRRADVAMGSRKFQDSNCTEVVWALALSAALSIDPEAELSLPQGEGSISSQEAAQTEHAAGVGVGSRGEPSGVGKPGSPPVPGSEVLPRAPELEADRPPASYRWTLGPLALLDLSFKPKLALGLGASIGLSDTSGRTVFPVELYLDLHYESTRLNRGSDPWRLDSLTASVSYCPLRIRARHSFALLWCGGARAGGVMAAGLGLQNSRRVTRSLLLVGSALRNQFAISSNWQLTGLLEVAVPLVERSFAIDSEDSLVARSRVVGAKVGLGATYGF